MTYQSDIKYWRAQRKNAAVWAEVGLSLGANYAFTLNPDIYGCNETASAGRLNGICKNLFQAINHELLGMTKAQALRKTALSFIGAYELRNRRGLIYPHAHIAFRWDRDLSPFEVFMMERWGAEVGGNWVPALGTPVDSHLGRRPQWELKPITNMDGWASYIRKQMKTDVQGVGKEMHPRQYIRRSRDAT